MQVFIVGTPFETAMSLSPRHLNNQINEAKVILDALNGAKAWSNHPCVLQYRGHEKWLMNYMGCLIRYQAGAPTMAKVSSQWCKIHGTPSFHTQEYFDQMKRRLYTKDPVHYEQWAHLGTSEDNWYWSQRENKFIKYRNGKRID
jgi:hypothetical protein